GEVQSKPSRITRSSNQPAADAVRGLLVAALDVVGQQQGEKRHVIQLLGAGQGEALRQGGQQRTEFGPLSRLTRSGSTLIAGSPLVLRRNDDRTRCRDVRNDRSATVGRAPQRAVRADLR